MRDDHKTCTKCQQEKPRSEYYADRRKRDGLQSACKPCCNASTRDYYRRNFERLSALDHERYVANRQQIADVQRDWYERNRVKRTRQERARRLAKMGLTIEAYDAMLHGQAGRCLICGTDQPGMGHRRLVVDHCKVSGRVRGLLCSPCNTAIGLLGHDPARIVAAAKYCEE